MKKIFFIFSIIFSTALAYGAQVDASKVKVLIAGHVNAKILEAKGSYQVINLQNDKTLSSGKNKRFIISPSGDGIRWGEAFPGIYQIKIIPEENSSLLLDGIQYGGNICIYYFEGALHFVNEVTINEYLGVILSTNLSLIQSPLSALEAIAICERTHICYQIDKHTHEFYHVKAEDVGYLGSSVCSNQTYAMQAVENTKRKVLKFKNNLFPALWSEHCGGNTASYSAIFREKVHCPSGSEILYAKKDLTEVRWQHRISKQRLAKLLKLAHIEQVQLFVDQESEKCYGMRFIHGSMKKDLSLIQVEKCLGKGSIQSSKISVRLEGNDVVFSGVGKGHGVGLCAYSANKMAKAGLNAEEILNKFFPKTYLTEY